MDEGGVIGRDFTGSLAFDWPKVRVRHAGSSKMSSANR
jgi:hypothetical protein